MNAIALSEFVLLFLLGLISVPMPLSVPPLPEDQNLLRASINGVPHLAFTERFPVAKGFELPGHHPIKCEVDANCHPRTREPHGSSANCAGFDEHLRCRIGES